MTICTKGITDSCGSEFYLSCSRDSKVDSPPRNTKISEFWKDPAGPSQTRSLICLLQTPPLENSIG